MEAVPRGRGRDRRQHNVLNPSTASPRGSLGQPALPGLECRPRWLASPNLKVLSLDFVAEQSLKDGKLEALGLPPFPEALRPGPLSWGGGLVVPTTRLRFPSAGSIAICLGSFGVALAIC